LTPTTTGGWFEENGDVYHPVVTAETNSFQTVQVFRTLEHPPHENFFQLLRFDWPSGKITPLQRFQRLRIWPVTGELEQLAELGLFAANARGLAP
jgi:hypothetical protein